MNESRLPYRLFINFSVTTVIGLLALLISFTVQGVSEISVQTIWFVPASAAVISVMFEVLFVNIFPISEKGLKRNILWRNRLIAAVVNAVLVAILGHMMLGIDSLLLLLISVGACVVAVIIAAILSELRHKIAVKEMNRRLQQLNGIKGDCDLSDGE
ncbi:MAG: hypothetical protein J5938_05875 [Clostridia bacterium]|nr:hypothetical protein [Clostridia bacterium]MBO4798204.1 hypothetical protein [Candidatus Methanomethylophilaceae archaeon]MBQ4290219.1 hypothetical protein [Clostridia bacterium]